MRDARRHTTRVTMPNDVPVPCIPMTILFPPSKRGIDVVFSGCPATCFFKVVGHQESNVCKNATPCERTDKVPIHSFLPLTQRLLEIKSGIAERLIGGVRDQNRRWQSAKKKEKQGQTGDALGISTRVPPHQVPYYHRDTR
jgi:hypothetical protein